MVQGTSWDDVKLFLALVRTRRLAAAAKTLGVDISTTSRRLARLEEQLGLSLFDRRRDGLVATDAAMRLLAPAEEMERASHGFGRQVDVLERRVEGPVRISTPPGIAESFVGPLLNDLALRHPGIRFEVDASTRQVDLTKREADLVVRTVKPKGGPLVRQRLARARWIPMASPALAASLGVVRNWNDVPWIGWAYELERLHASRWLTTHLKAEPVLKTNSFALQVATVQRGLGAALMPEQYLSVHQFAPLQLSRTLTAEAKSLPRDDLWLVAHEGLRRVPRVAAVWDYFVAVFSARSRVLCAHLSAQPRRFTGATCAERVDQPPQLHGDGTGWLSVNALVMPRRSKLHAASR